MGLGSLGSSILSDANGIVGNIDKAVLIFPGEAKTNAETVNLEGVDNKNSMGAQKKLQDAKEQTQNKTKNVINSVSTKTKDKQMEGKKFTVQFNPSSIRINARGGGRVPISNFMKNDKNQAGTVDFKALDPYINVSFTVIFDAFNQADAFMEERFTLGATTLAKNVATAAVTGAGKEFSVRPVVEGFLAAIRNENHRRMIFRWGNLKYEGILNSVSGKYTMFNTKGHPIRAEINISMLMGGGSDKSGYLNYWQTRYGDILKDNARKKDEKQSSMDLGTVKQQFSNLLNL